MTQRVLLLTPPFTQLNTPYPATAALCGFLREKGVTCFQNDLSIDVALDVFRTYGPRPLTETVLSFLQGRNPAAAHLLARQGFLPEGPAFAEIAPEGTGLTRDEALNENFGVLGVTDRAKHLCSLWLDDLAADIRARVDPDFGFSRYAERLAVRATELGPLLQRLRRRSAVDRLSEAHVEKALAAARPTHIGITCPFPGTLLGALRIARAIRKTAPKAKIYLGGGYVSTELREMSDPRLFDFFDGLLFDEGYGPWLGVLGLGPVTRMMTRATLGTVPCAAHETPVPPFVAPDYAGLDFSHYLSLVEMANPAHRLWSDGRWLKIQLARGCYWHRCAFCDVKLDYIGCFAAPKAADVVDAMERLAAATGETGFHFTDEAVPPALARAVSEELLRRGDVFSWWGNIRFDRAYTPELAALMARAGCVAVTGGLECAGDRLLKLMSKGITRASARAALRAFSRAGVLVHAYLMYGFPTQTEDEAVDALGWIRDRFAAGEIQSAFYHRFALTVHSPIAADPSRFGITLRPEAPCPRRFAYNEIFYDEPDAPDWDRIGRGLRLALYNYMLGLGLDLPPDAWFAGV